jgi:hypothetical protein
MTERIRWQRRAKKVVEVPTPNFIARFAKSTADSVRSAFVPGVWVPEIAHRSHCSPRIA